jgi:hypothetical protein
LASSSNCFLHHYKGRGKQQKKEEKTKKEGLPAGTGSEKISGKRR